MKTNTLLPLVGLLAITAFLSGFSAKKTAAPDPEITFQDFLAQFPAQRLPYTLDEKSLQNNLNAYVREINDQADNNETYHVNRLGWDYFKFLPELENQAMFSRLPLQVEPVAVFATANYVAVLYGTSRGSRFAYATYHITMLDPSGKFISTNMVGKVMPDAILSANIAADFQVTTQSWNIKWQKDYDKTGIQGNKIKGLALAGTASIDLTQPTPLPESRIKELLAPPVLEEAKPLEGVKSK